MQSSVDDCHKLIIDQLQMSLAHTPAFDSGLTVNMNIGQSIDRTGGIYEYSRLKGIDPSGMVAFPEGVCCMRQLGMSFPEQKSLGQALIFLCSAQRENE